MMTLFKGRQQEALRTLRRAGLPLSRATRGATGRTSAPLWMLLGTVVIGAGYIGLGGSWALRSMMPAEDAQVAQPAVQPLQAPSDDIIAAALRAQEAEALHRQAQELMQQADARLQEAETPATRVEIVDETAEQIAAEVAMAEAAMDCVQDLTQMAQQVTLRFDLGAVQPSGPELVAVQALADAASDCPAAKVIVGGHTDSSGDELVNMQIAWARAENTVNWIASQGYPTEAFMPMGYGTRQPLAEGDAPGTEDAAERRVTFLVVRRTDEGTQ